jgi:transposase
MLVQRAYKAELDLNDEQVTSCRQHAGAARWAYNWGLQLKQERYRATKKCPTAIELHRELKRLEEDPGPLDVPRLQVCPTRSPVEPRCGLSNVFRRCALKKQGKWKGKLGYPRLKTKKKGVGSFRLTDRVVAGPQTIVLSRLGCLQLKERGYLLSSDDVKIVSATVSEQAGHWYVSVLVEQE